MLDLMGMKIFLTDVTVDHRAMRVSYVQWVREQIPAVSVSS